MQRVTSLQGSRKVVAWAGIGLLVGLVFGLVWHVFEPRLAMYFWPFLGALIFGQHAFRSNQRISDRGRPKLVQPSTDDTR